MILDLKAPHTVYRAKNGDRLPGVTTICQVLAKPHLLGWYAEMERKGILAAIPEHTDKVDEVLDWEALENALPKRTNGKVLPFAEIKRDKAADLGTITHARVQAWLNADTLDPHGIPADLYEKSQHGLDRFIEWWERSGFRLLRSEQQLIHDRAGMRYGGTADILALDASLSNVLIDLKTSKASQYWPYDETFAQVAAYGEASEADEDVGLDVVRIIVARIGKEPGDTLQVYELSVEERLAGWSLFRAAHAAHEAKKALERARK